MATIPDIDQFWPEVAQDLTLVTWAHATNSQKLLDEAISNDSIMMMEADVLMGHLEGTPITEPAIPIMSHPPAVISDLSLQSFIEQLIEKVKQGKIKKGIKLDFKQLAVVQQSLDILSEHRDQLNLPVLLNADVLAGPVAATSTPLDPAVFLSLCVEFFPEATLSLGWTTRFTTSDDSAGQFTTADVKLMVDTVEMNHVTQPVTFAVRAAFVQRSQDSLAWLLDAVPDSTLTVWSSETDVVNIPSLVWLQEVAGAEFVYFDLPADQMREFNNLRPGPTGSAAVQFWPKGAAVYATVVVLVLAFIFSQLHTAEE